MNEVHNLHALPNGQVLEAATHIASVQSVKMEFYRLLWEAGLETAEAQVGLHKP